MISIFSRFHIFYSNPCENKIGDKKNKTKKKKQKTVDVTKLS